MEDRPAGRVTKDGKFVAELNGKYYVFPTQGLGEDEAAEKAITGQIAPLRRFNDENAAIRFRDYGEENPYAPVKSSFEPKPYREVHASPQLDPRSGAEKVGTEIPVHVTMQPRTHVGIAPPPELTPQQAREMTERVEAQKETGVPLEEDNPFLLALRPFLNVPQRWREHTQRGIEDIKGAFRTDVEASPWLRAGSALLGMGEVLWTPAATVGSAVGEAAQQFAHGLGASKGVSDYVKESAGVAAETLTGTGTWRNMLLKAVGLYGQAFGGSKIGALRKLGEQMEMAAPQVGAEHFATAKAAADRIRAFADQGIDIPPRFVAKEVDKLLPRDWRFGNIWGNVMEVISIPTKAKIIPTYKEGMKSLQEIIQPAVERLHDIGLDKPFRLARAKKQLTMRAGEELGVEIAKLKPGERLDVFRGLKGQEMQTEAAKGVVKRFNTRVQGFDLGRQYQAEFYTNLKKQLSKVDVPEMDGAGAERIGKFFDQVDAGVKGKVNERQIRKEMLKVLKEPSVPDDLKRIVTDLYNLPADTPRAVAKASTKASRAYMLSGLKESGAIADLPDKARSMLVSDKTHNSFRDLWGKYVPRDVWLELKAWQDVSKASHYMMNKWFMTPWKTMKVVLRPATHVRNTVSNMILNDLGGLPFYRWDRYAQALSEMKDKGRYYREFRNLTGSGGTFTANDVAQLSDGLRLGAGTFDRMLMHFDKLVQKPRSLYNAEEQFFKLAKFIHNRKAGMDAYEAATDAMKWTFNYGEVTRFTARARATAVPFFTWQSKVLPLMAESVKKHPLRLGKWIGMYEGLQLMNLDRLDMGEEEWEYLHKILPEYVADSQFLLLPFRDDKDRLQMLNLTYMIPGFGDITQIEEDPWGAVFASPLLNIAGTLTTKTKFSGAPLYYDWEEPTVKASKVFSYVWQQLMPSWSPGGQDAIWSKMYQYMTDHPDAPTWYQMLGQEMGFKIQVADEAKLVRRRAVLEDIKMSQIESEYIRKLNEGVRSGKSDADLQEIAARFALLRQELMMPKERGGLTSNVLSLLGR